MTITDTEFEKFIDFLKTHKQDIIELPTMTIEKIEVQPGPREARRFEPAKELKMIIRMNNPLTDPENQTHTIFG